MYMLAVFVGTISISLYMKCNRCQGTFRSYKRRTFPDTPGYYFADPSYRPSCQARAFESEPAETKSQ